jgi:hypothetical protein
MEKMLQAAAVALKEQLSKNNKRDLMRQFIVLKYVPTLVVEVLTKVRGEELTFAAQDMAQEILVQISDVGVNSTVF